MNDPSEASAEALLSPMSGAAAIGLSLGDALPLLAGALPCHSFSFDDSCRLYVFPQEHAYLESYAFRAALLTALTSGALTAFVYDETDDASAYLRTHLNDLMDQLYAGFFAEKQAAIGRAQPLAPRDTAWLTELAALCNKNRPNEVLRALDALPAEHVVMSDALRIHNLCEALLCRLSNTPSAPGLRYGYELAARYATFAQMLDALRGRLQRSVGPAVDPDRLHNETLARIVRELNRDFMKDVSFQELCGRFCINPSYLSQLFKKELDVTFTSYLNRLRIGYAKELLESTTILVSEISDRVGYDNYLNFTKLFKRETGMTPKQYRAQSQKGLSGAER